MDHGSIGAVAVRRVRRPGQRTNIEDAIPHLGFTFPGPHVIRENDSPSRPLSSLQSFADPLRIGVIADQVANLRELPESNEESIAVLFIVVYEPYRDLVGVIEVRDATSSITEKSHGCLATETV